MKNTILQTQLESMIVAPSDSIGEALRRLDKAGSGALAVCSASHQLLGFLTDGDIRRAILKNCSLDDPCSLIANSHPVTASDPIAPDEALRLMNRYDISHLPVTGADGTLLDLILRRDVGSREEVALAAQRRLESAIISPASSISDAIAHLDKAGTGALVLCTENRVLRGLLTDGDIRRAILQGQPMSDPCETICTRIPMVAPCFIPSAEALELMNQHDINHLLLVDSENHVFELLLRKDLDPDVRLELPAVIMAGGFGKRLMPLTESVPKPMLPVGDRPLLELIIQQLRRSGIRDVNLTTHYLPDSIVNHFGDGGAFGVKLNYLQEDHPMGTAGGLKKMKRPRGPLLVVNGDILTGVHFQEMFAYHRKHGSSLTVGVRKYALQVPFGVVECAGSLITSIQEKPLHNFFINAGTYLLEPAAWDRIPADRPFDMTDLIQLLIEEGSPVASYPIMEYWLDVGKKEDYQQAQEDVRSGKFKS